MRMYIGMTIVKATMTNGEIILLYCTTGTFFHIVIATTRNSR